MPAHSGQTELCIAGAARRSYLRRDKPQAVAETGARAATDETEPMTHTRIAPIYSVTLTALFREILASFRAGRARRAAFNQAYAELQSMSDRELREFGLHRSDIADLARRQVCGHA